MAAAAKAADGQELGAAWVHGSDAGQHWKRNHSRGVSGVEVVVVAADVAVAVVVPTVISGNGRADSRLDPSGTYHCPIDRRAHHQFVCHFVCHTLLGVDRPGDPLSLIV